MNTLNDGNIFLSWDKVTQYCSRITNELEHESIEIIMPIISGGLVPASILSHQMKIPMIAPITYRKADKCNLNAMINFVSQGKTLLIIDSMINSGDTMNQIQKYAEAYIELQVIKTHVFYASLVKKKSTWVKYKVNYGIEFETFQWIFFPWEVSSLI